MRRKKRSLKFLALSLLSFIFLLYIIVYTPPSFKFTIFPAERNLASQDNFQIPILIPFFTLLFIFVYSIIAFMFKSSIHGVLAGLFVVLYLVLRMKDLTHPFFLVLLFAIFLTLDIFFSKRS